MRIWMCEQRSLEWIELRRGVITASACSAILYPSGRNKYLAKLIKEIQTGESESFEVNEYMQRGIDFEDEARRRYLECTKNTIVQVGFCKPNDDDRVGCSPDGLVKPFGWTEDRFPGVTEFKCPMTKNHLINIEKGPNAGYKTQMQFQMMVTETDWADFASWDNRVDREEALRTYEKTKLKDSWITEDGHEVCFRIRRDEEAIQKLETAVYWLKQDLDRALM